MDNKEAKQLGLWDRIRMKRERGGTPAKPGDADYPDAKNWKKVTGLNKKTEKQSKDKACSCGCGDTVKTCKCGPSCSCRKPGGSCYRLKKKASNPFISGSPKVPPATAPGQQPAQTPAQSDGPVIPDWIKPEYHEGLRGTPGGRKYMYFPHAENLPGAGGRVVETETGRVMQSEIPDRDGYFKYLQDGGNPDPKPMTFPALPKPAQAPQTPPVPQVPKAITPPTPKSPMPIKPPVPPNPITSSAHAFGELAAKTAANSPAWQRSEGKNEEGGLNAKGRASYNKATGGNLKAPVTESDPKGDRAKRQNSFCSRMCGMKRVNTGSKAKKDPDSRINKSLRKWNCKCSNAREFGQELYKQAIGVGTGVGLIGGLMTGHKNDRLNSGMRGAVKGLGFDVGAGLGGTLGTLAGVPFGLGGMAAGGLAGGIGGGTLGTLAAGHALGPYETEKEKFKRLAKKYHETEENEEEDKLAAFGQKLAQQGAPAMPQYSQKPFDPAYARAAFDQHKIPYNPQATDQQLYNLMLSKGRIPPGAKKMTPFQATVGDYYGGLPPRPLQPAVSPGLMKTQAAKSKSAAVFDPPVTYPQLQVTQPGEIAQHNIQNQINQLSHFSNQRRGDLYPAADIGFRAAPFAARTLGAMGVPGVAMLSPGLDVANLGLDVATMMENSNARRDAQILQSEHAKHHPAHPVTLPKNLQPRKPVSIPNAPANGPKPAPVPNASTSAAKPEPIPNATAEPAPAAVKPETPAAPATTPAAPAAPPPAAEPGKPFNWNALLAGGGLSAAGLLALYYMMQNRNTPRKKKRRDEQE